MTSWFDIRLNFDLAVETFKILSGLYLENHKVMEVDTLWEQWLGSVGVPHLSVTLI